MIVIVFATAHNSHEHRYSTVLNPTRSVTETCKINKCYGGGAHGGSTPYKYICWIFTLNPAPSVCY